jgi:hypothetical protein
MDNPVGRTVLVVTLVILGIAIAAASFYVAQIDDAPGAAGFGVLFMIAAITGAVKIARRKR